METRKSKIITLYEKILLEMKEWPMQSTVMSNENIIAHRFPHGRVGEKLISKDAQNMASGTGKTFILDAQTGAAKSTFIFEKLLPELKKRGRKVLYLVPRVSLSLSVKKQLTEYDEDVKEIRKCLSNYGMSKQIDFDVMDVITYQSVFKLNNHSTDDYGLIVFDEVQYFFEDSLFNRETELQFEFLFQKFAEINKIFISATMEDIFDFIYQKYLEIMPLIYNQQCLEYYYVERDYSYIRPQFFSDEKQLYTKIENSSKKWLIFVDSIEAGNMLEDHFNQQMGKKAIFFDAKAKGDSRADRLTQMITDEILEEDVGILTSAFDVGINIKNSNIAIVLFTYTKTQFLQELGRKRVKQGEGVEVFISIPSREKIGRRLASIKNMIEKIDEREKYYKEHPLFYGYNLPMPFICVDGVVEINSFSVRKLKVDCRYYEGMLNFDDEEYEQHYMRMVLGWMEWSEADIEEYLENIDTKDEEKNKLRSLIEQVDREIPIDEFEDFAQKVLKICDLRADKRADRQGGIQAVNRALKLISFKAQKVEDAYIIKPI